MSRRLAMEHLESRIVMDGAGIGLAVTAEGEGTPHPDFQLPDVNPASARFGESVSPRDYLDQTSAWYFGHST